MQNASLAGLGLSREIDLTEHLGLVADLVKLATCQLEGIMILGVGEVGKNVG